MRCVLGNGILLISSIQPNLHAKLMPMAIRIITIQMPPLRGFSIVGVVFYIDAVPMGLKRVWDSVSIHMSPSWAKMICVQKPLAIRVIRVIRDSDKNYTCSKGSEISKHAALIGLEN